MRWKEEDQVSVHGYFKISNSKNQIPNTNDITALANWNVLSSKSYMGLLFGILVIGIYLSFEICYLELPHTQSRPERIQNQKPRERIIWRGSRYSVSKKLITVSFLPHSVYIYRISLGSQESSPKFIIVISMS